MSEIGFFDNVNSGNLERYIKDPLKIKTTVSSEYFLTLNEL